MWRGGCIIRSRFLGNIKAAYDKNSELDNLLLDDFFKNAINECQASWRKVVANAVQLGVPTPCFSTGKFFKIKIYAGAWERFLPRGGPSNTKNEIFPILKIFTL